MQAVRVSWPRRDASCLSVLHFAHPVCACDAPCIALDGVTVTTMILRGSSTTANEIVVTLMDLQFDMFTLEATKYVTAQVACPSALWTYA